MRIAPSVGRTKPGKRASNRAVLALSSILRQTVRPIWLSCAFHTFDMLPGPRWPKRWKRLEMSTRGIFFFGSDLNQFLRNDDTLMTMAETQGRRAKSRTKAESQEPKAWLSALSHRLANVWLFALRSQP